MPELTGIQIGRTRGMGFKKGPRPRGEGVTARLSKVVAAEEPIFFGGLTA